MFPSFSTFVSTPTLNTYHKSWQLMTTVGLTRFNYMRSMVFQSISKFLPDSRLVFGSLLFIADKMGDLSLQELESWGSGTDWVHPIPAWYGLACEAQLGHRSSIWGELEPDPLGDNVDHHKICCLAATYPIYKSSPKSNSDSGR
jgi:hypothetical protein